MGYDKIFLRKKFLNKRKKKYSADRNFNFNLIFGIIKKHFQKKKIAVAGYYPSYYEVNILKFLEEATNKKFKIVLPVIKHPHSMSFKLWAYKEPLYVNNFGILEKKNFNLFYKLEENIGFGLNPKEIVGNLRIADQQKVEIMRALARDAKVIIMDEPTS